MPCLPCAGAHAHLHMTCLPHLHMPAHLQTQGWGRNVTKVRSTRCCCKHTHVCCRILKLRLSPKGQRLHRFGRPPAAVGTHMCVAEYFNAELHRGSRFTKVWPTNAAGGIHMCVAEQVKSGLHPRVTSKKRLADQLLLRAYTCVLQNRSNQGCTQGSTCYQGSADQVLLQAYICVLQNIKAQGFTQGSTVTKDCPTTGCCRHTHVCRRTNQCRVAPRAKAGKGLADQVLLGAYTCVPLNRRIQGCTRGSKVTKV